MEHFLLLDLETTGLDPTRCRVVEVAARLLVPGREVARYHAVIHCPKGLDCREPGARDMHMANGLYEECRHGGREIDVADDELTKILDINVPASDPVYLMGNSIGFDRYFIALHMPRLHKRLHYRMLDVTSVRLWHTLMSGKDPHVELPKPHRAQEDIDNSLKQAMAMWQGR